MSEEYKKRLEEILAALLKDKFSAIDIVRISAWIEKSMMQKEIRSKIIRGIAVDLIDKDAKKELLDTVISIETDDPVSRLDALKRMVPSRPPPKEDDIREKEKQWEHVKMTMMGTCAICPRCGGSSTSFCDCARQSFMSNNTSYYQ